MKLLRIAVPIVSAAAIAVSVAAVASADPSPKPSPKPSTGSAADGANAARHGNRLLRHALHGEFTVGSKQGTDLHVAVIQRGEITAVDSTHKTVTMKSPDGFTRSYAVTDATKIRSKHTQESFSDLKVGDRAMVEAEQNGSTYTARVIRCIKTASSGSSTTTG